MEKPGGNLLEHLLLPGYNLHSRITNPRGYFNSSGTFIKREDELSSGLPGCKFRKMVSLFRYYLEGKYTRIHAIGSPNSNNLIGIAQFCNEKKIPFTFYLPGRIPDRVLGNYLWMKLLAGKENIIFTGDKTAAQVEKELKKQLPPGEMIIPEGALMPEALPGAMTLAEDILRNEAENGIRFRDIFIDCGTGMSAIGLILGLTYFNESDRTIHITFIAEPDEKLFINKLETFSKKSGKLLGKPTPKNFPRLSFIHPPTAKSFGSVNKALINEVEIIAKETGILADPVYSVKHFMAARNKINTFSGEGTNLVILNGGAMGLSGFQAKLSGTG